MQKNVLQVTAKKGKRKTRSQSPFTLSELNTGYNKLHNGICKVKAEDTVYIVHDHAKIQDE